MNKADIYKYLDDHHIWHVVTEHGPVFTMEELTHVGLAYPEAEGKNLFLRDSGKKQYFLLTVKGDVPVDLKKFRENQGTRRLSFATPEEMDRMLGLIPGAVSPLGLMNDEERKVVFYLDRKYLEPPAIIGIHPNDNSATVAMKVEDLVQMLKDHGTEVRFFDV